MTATSTLGDGYADTSDLAPIDDRPGLEPWTTFVVVDSCQMCGTAILLVTIQLPVAFRALGPKIENAVRLARHDHDSLCPTCREESRRDDAALAERQRRVYEDLTPEQRAEYDASVIRRAARRRAELSHP